MIYLPVYSTTFLLPSSPHRDSDRTPHCPPQEWSGKGAHITNYFTQAWSAFRGQVSYIRKEKYCTATTTTTAVSRSGYHPWILRRGGLESSVRRLISYICKTMKKTFFRQKSFLGKKKEIFLRIFQNSGFMIIFDNLWIFHVLFVYLLKFLD